MDHRRALEPASFSTASAPAPPLVSPSHSHPLHPTPVVVIVVAIVAAIAHCPHPPSSQSPSSDPRLHAQNSIIVTSWPILLPSSSIPLPFSLQ